MKKQRQTAQGLAVYSTLLGATLVTYNLQLGPQRSVAYQVAPPVVSPVVLNLTGVVRDFSSTHPDFGITNVAAMGHYVGTVAPALGADRRPASTGIGLQVATEWTDQYFNPIIPYAGPPDPGLPGGHFDVDVYDVPSTQPLGVRVRPLYHEHQFDDKFDVTHVDIANDPNLLFDVVVGAGYPNNLSMTMDNVLNGGGGTFRFHAVGARGMPAWAQGRAAEARSAAAGAPGLQGRTADGFTATFAPAKLTKLRVDFVSLAALRSSGPGNAQSDALNRDNSLRIRMYDVMTNVMVYELVVYHHFEDENGNGIADDLEAPAPLPVIQNDSCGAPINDTAGAHGLPGTGDITDSTTFGQWFRDVLGTNQSTAHTISLQRDATGVYDYSTTSFFPIDGRLRGNEGAPNNNLFTYTISASFTYHACTGQFFEFESNDDAWAFVDSKLVIDLGGTATPVRQYVDLDRLGLVTGQGLRITAHR